MTTILSLDPGAERTVSDTGYCYGEFEDNKPFRLLDSGVVHGGFNGFVRSAKSFGKLEPYIFTADIVVCEQFISWEPRADSTPRLIEGVVRYLRPDAVLQPASGKNTLVPNKFLRAQGYWGTKGTGAGHHRDRVEAIRHAYFYLARNSHIPTLRELEGVS